MTETKKAVDKTGETTAAERPATPHTAVGRVVSNKMKKTIVVSVDRQYIHPSTASA